jgi:uncharacterized protein YllA (UPF0747 family)
MSEALLGGEVHQLYEQLCAASGSGADVRPLDAAGAFAPGATIGGAYVQMLRELLEPLGIAVLDAAHPAVGDASRVLLEQALNGAHRIHAAVGDRQRAIESAGFSPQVDTERGLSLVFGWRPLASGRASKRRIPLGDTPHSQTSRLSPNVLLRPVVERYMLPTVAYVGGPGEIAYFSQVTAVADALGIPSPVVVPRWSGMLIPDDTAAAMAGLGLSVEDLRDQHAAEGRIAAAAVPTNAQDAVASLRDAHERELGRLDGALGPRAIAGMRAQFEMRVQKLERRLRAAAKHREQATMRQIAAARGLLYPFGQAQDRALNTVPLWSRFGDGFIDAIRPPVAAHARRMVTGAAPVV